MSHHPQPIRGLVGGEGFYPSIEVQLAYSTALANKVELVFFLLAFSHSQVKCCKEDDSYPKSLML